MRILAAAFLLLASPPAAQDQRPSVAEVRARHEEAIRKVEGVIAVTTGGTAEEPRIIVQVASEEAKKAVLAQVGKEIEGYKVYVLVSPPTSPGQTVVEKKPDTPSRPTKEDPPKERDPLDDCDIMREHRKLKTITHHKDGKTIPNCAVSLRQQIGGGGGHSYAYTKHRPDCPVRLGSVKEPAEADGFVRWVFRVGFSPALRASFLGGYELKGSDRLWFSQVREDLTSRLPYIREGAVWVEVRDDKAGVGWKWEVPK